MKATKYLSMVLAALFLISAVSATETTLNDDSLTLAYFDATTVEFCIYDQNDAPMDVSVVVDPICRDLDNLYGCQGADDFTPVGFSVVPQSPTTGADGCVLLDVTTSIVDPADGGLFYYTVNGMIGDAEVGAETGQVFVPEFGVVAAAGILGAAGYFIAKKRK